MKQYFTDAHDYMIMIHNICTMFRINADFDKYYSFKKPVHFPITCELLLLGKLRECFTESNTVTFKDISTHALRPFCVELSKWMTMDKTQKITMPVCRICPYCLVYGNCTKKDSQYWDLVAQTRDQKVVLTDKEIIPIKDAILKLIDARFEKIQNENKFQLYNDYIEEIN